MSHYSFYGKNISTIILMDTDILGCVITFKNGMTMKNQTCTSSTKQETSSTTILPTRPAAPKDKPLVEGAVRIVYAWIFARLRNRIFHDLDELNAAIFQWLDDHNNRPMQKIKISGNDLFEEIEKEFQTQGVNFEQKQKKTEKGRIL